MDDPAAHAVPAVASIALRRPCHAELGPALSLAEGTAAAAASLFEAGMGQHVC